MSIADCKICDLNIIPMKLKEEVGTFKEYLDKIKPEVDERIKIIAEKKISDLDIIPMLLKGKRLRAGLTLLVFDSISDKNQDRSSALDLACAIELAHSASLILDDMLDEDTERRGLPTLHLAKNHKIAMLNTIDVLSLPYDIVAQHGRIYVEMLAETQRSMVCGVIKELFNKPDLPATKLYDAITIKKTGKLFNLATIWGYQIAHPINAIPCGCFSFDYCHVGDFGLQCGKAMQIADDIADINQLITNKKKGSFGSEILLLRCVAIDSLVKELIREIKKQSIDMSKLKDLWSQESLQKTLYTILDKEISKAVKAAVNINVRYDEYKKIMLSAPKEITDMMLKE